MTHLEFIVRIPIKMGEKKVTWDLKCDVGGWRDGAGLGRDPWRNGRAQTNQCIRSLPPPFLQTPWLRVITICDLCFVSWGHQLWAPSASQTFHLLLPSARWSGTVERLVGGEVTRSSVCARWVWRSHTRECALWVWRSHTLRCTNDCRLFSDLCICIYFFLALPVGSV